MRTTALLCCFVLLCVISNAQQGIGDKHVVLTGIAEQTFDPEYIELSISNRETQRSGSEKYAVAEGERELRSVLSRFGMDSSQLRVDRFNTGNHYSIMSGNKFNISKSYLLTINDLSRYEDIVLAIANAGFKSTSIERLGVYDLDRKEQMVISSALAAGKAKAAGILPFLDGRKLRLTGVEELPNNHRADQDDLESKRGRGQGISIGGGRSEPPANMLLSKFLIRKAFQLRFAIE